MSIRVYNFFLWENVYLYQMLEVREGWVRLEKIKDFEGLKTKAKNCRSAHHKKNKIIKGYLRSNKEFIIDYNNLIRIIYNSRSKLSIL